MASHSDSISSDIPFSLPPLSTETAGHHHKRTAWMLFLAKRKYSSFSVFSIWTETLLFCCFKSFVYLEACLWMQKMLSCTSFRKCSSCVLTISLLLAAYSLCIPWQSALGVSLHLLYFLIRCYSPPPPFDTTRRSGVCSFHQGWTLSRSRDQLSNFLLGLCMTSTIRNGQRFIHVIAGLHYTVVFCQVKTSSARFSGRVCSSQSQME